MKSAFGRTALPWYLSASFFISMLLEMYWNGAISYFYMNTLGLKVKYGAVVWSVFSAFMVLTSVFCGKRSDRRQTTSQRGRRIPYIRVFGPIAGIAFAIAFVPFGGGSQLLLALRLLLLLCAIDLSCEFVSASLFAIPSEELADLRRRGMVYSLFSVVQYVGGLLAILVLPLLQPDKGEDSTVFCLMMMAFGLLGAAVCYFASRRLPSTYRVNTAAIHSTSYLASLKQCLRNRRFLIGEIFLTFTVIGAEFLTFGLFYYVDDCLVTLDFTAAIYILSAIGGMASVYLLFFKAVKRLGKRRLVAATGLCSAAGLLVMFFFEPYFLGRLLGFFSMGISLAIQYFYNPLLVADFVDADEAVTGLRKEGEYFGLDSLLDNAAVVCQPVFLAIILAFGYLESLGTGAQSAAAKHGILVGWLLTAAVFLAAGSVAMLLFYPDDGGQKNAVDAD